MKAVSRRALSSLERGLRIAVAVLVVVAAVLAVRTVEGTGGQGRPPKGLVLGVLQADAHYLATDARAGFRSATVSLDWASWEPQPGEVDSQYRAQAVSAVAAYRSAGWTVYVDLGLQYPPAWEGARPDALLVDQSGTAAGVANFEFSEQVRVDATQYMADVVSHLGAVSGYRIGLSQDGEVGYPSVAADNWWAYGPDAQGAAGGRPPGLAASPLPGWVPGQPSWRGQPVTTSQVQEWYAWYLGAMVGAHTWEMDTFRRLGFAGSLLLVMPGLGALPGLYQQRLAQHLVPTGADLPYRTVNTASVWWKVLGMLPLGSHVVLDISSVYDDSGSPRGNVCQPSDSEVSIGSAPVLAWSDTRYLTALARRHGLAVMGENPGSTPPQDVQGVFRLARACGLRSLQWAFEPQLHGTHYADLTQVSAAARAAG